MPAQLAPFSDNPLATPAQLDIERRLIALLAHPSLVAAREQARDIMRDSPATASADGARLQDRAIESWLSKMLFDTLANAAAKAEILWSNQIAPYEWHGHRVPSSATAIDTPDFLYRRMAFDGWAEYEIRGTVVEPAAAIAFQLSEYAGSRDGFAVQRGGGSDIDSLGVLDGGAIKYETDGSFLVTIGPSAANGRSNHLQSPPRRLQLVVRNVLDRWDENGHALSVTRLDGAAESDARDDDSIIRQVAEDFPYRIRFWLDYRGQLAGNPPVNQLVGPHMRTGGWSSAAFVRTQLDDDEAIVLTLEPVAAGYIGIQFADTLMISPDPVEHFCSFNRSQTQPNPDGSLTYVLAKNDPAAANWLDPAGSATGWIAVRWFGLAADAGSLIRELRVGRLSEILPDVIGSAPVTAEQRQLQLVERQAGWRYRVRP